MVTKSFKTSAIARKAPYKPKHAATDKKSQNRVKKMKGRVVASTTTKNIRKNGVIGVHAVGVQELTNAALNPKKSKSKGGAGKAYQMR